MTLRRKTLLISALAMLLLAGGFYVVAALIQAQGHAQIERSQIRGGVARAWQALAREADDLQSIMRNYTGTGDPLGLTIGTNRQYLNYTFSDDVLHNMRVDVVLLLNAAGEIVFSKRLAHTPRNAPHASLDEFAQAVFASSRTTPDISGYFPLPEHLVMFAAQPVLPLNGADALKGTLIFGRAMNAAALLRLNQTTQLIMQLRLIPSARQATVLDLDQSLPADFSAARQALSQAKENLLTVSMSDTISASYAIITDILENPAAILRMEAARTSHELGNASTRYLLWALLVAGLVLAAANVWIVDRLVLARMTSLSREVNRIAQNREFETRVGTSGNDELTGLALRVNELLTALHSQHELEQALAAAQDTTRAKSLFLANMSHELRTPLNAIIGFTGTLLMKLPGALNPQQDEQLTIVQTSARHLLSLINDLLDLAKIESGNMLVRPEPIALRALLEDVVAMLGPLAAKKGLALTLEAPREVRISTDSRALKQILLNLGNNAIKFTDTGSVALELKPPGQNHELEISVTDTGIGIRPEDQGKLFQAFAQMDSTRREGTGLGLQLSRHLAQLVGGRIEFSSQQGKGSRFWLTLPTE